MIQSKFGRHLDTRSLRWKDKEEEKDKEADHGKHLEIESRTGNERARVGRTKVSSGIFFREEGNREEFSDKLISCLLVRIVSVGRREGVGHCPSFLFGGSKHRGVRCGSWGVVQLVASVVFGCWGFPPPLGENSKFGYIFKTILLRGMSGMGKMTDKSARRKRIMSKSDKLWFSSFIISHYGVLCASTCNRRGPYELSSRENRLEERV